jgi:hypothetical protein
MRALLWYMATRLVGLAPLLWPEAVVLREPTKWLVDLERLGTGKALPEYPWLAVQLVNLPLQLGVPTILHYYAAVVAFFLAVDAGVARLLWRVGEKRMSRGLWLWLLAFPALGPLMASRFDVVPAALCTCALLALFRERPASAGALVSLGAGVKLWPALGLPALLIPGSQADRGRVLVGFAVVAVVLLGATLAAGGEARVWSPLVLQASRGLQIEAFPALPFLWLRHLAAATPWVVQGNEACNCHEISGPGVTQAVAIAGFATFVAAAGVLTIHVRAFFAPPEARTSALAALLTTVLIIAWVATARVFSPQYMIWLSAPLAVLGVLTGNRLARLDLALFIAACFLTHVVFPLGYDALVWEGHFLQGGVLLILTLRDALVVTLGVRLAVQAWRASAASVNVA